MKRLLVVLALVLVVAGCSEHKSVLDEGLCGSQTCDESQRVTEEQARKAGESELAMWEHELRKGAQERPNLRFDNLAPAELRRRLAKAAQENGFEVVSVKLHRPRQLAPEVVIRTNRYLAVSESAKFWLKDVDPQRPAKDDLTGWRFEGFFLRAEDERGVPFFIVSNFLRGSGGGGSQWARSERLYPFEHG